MGSLREHVCETRRDLRGVFCSQNAQRRLRMSRAHVLVWRAPRIARSVFFYARVTSWLHVWFGIRQEGVIPCRMVPSIRDEVHGSCMTSRARSSMCGYACRAKVRDVRVAALGPCASKFKNESIWNKRSKPRFRVNRISCGRGAKPPVSWGHRITTS